jgi:hypothetical protein
MAETAGANPGTAVRVRLNVEDDVVRVFGIACHCDAGGAADRAEMVEPESIARSPGDHAIGARSVAADPEAADSYAFLIEHEAPAEHVDSADALAD